VISSAELRRSISSNSWSWDSCRPRLLVWSCLGTNALPSLLEYMAPRLSYEPSVNPYVRESHPFASATNREEDGALN